MDTETNREVLYIVSSAFLEGATFMRSTGADAEGALRFVADLLNDDADGMAYDE